jgi:hypothetical protein
MTKQHLFYELNSAQKGLIIIAKLLTIPAIHTKIIQ